MNEPTFRVGHEGKRQPGTNEPQASASAPSCLRAFVPSTLRVLFPSWLCRPRNRPASPGVFSMEGGSATAAAAVPKTSLALLLSRHILRDGELILLILRPSLWLVLLTGLRFSAAVLILLGAAVLIDDRPTLLYLDVAIFLIAGRIAWSVLQWMGQLYLLTDLRIISLSGVFNIDIFDCPLRRVARTRLTRSVRERLFRLGSVEITPGDESQPAGYWHMIARPVEVHEQIVAAINRAKATGFGCNHAA